MRRLSMTAGVLGAILAMVVACLGVRYHSTIDATLGSESTIFILLLWLVALVGVTGVILFRTHPATAASLRLIAGMLFWALLGFEMKSVVVIPAVLLFSSGMTHAVTSRLPGQGTI